MTVSDLTAYFANYAAKHKFLLHTTEKPTFFCMNTEKNTEEFIRKNALDLIMILLVPDKDLNKSHDNYSWFRNCAFMVLKRVADATNENIIAGQNTAEIVCNDFTRKIIGDREILLDSIEDTGYSMHPVGPMGDYHYGYMTMFRQVDIFDWEVEGNNWNP